MPPRPTQAAVAASSAQAQQESIFEVEGLDSYELPKTVVTRLAKSGVSIDVVCRVFRKRNGRDRSMDVVYLVAT